MQLARFLVQEEGDRHAPVALARDAPVRAVGDHGVQARLAPVGEKFRRFDGSQRRLAQGASLDRLAIHADEPLRRGAVDDRRLVAPAMHVAVGDLVRGEQAADFAQLLDDGGVGIPDVEAAEEGQALGKAAVALHRREDLLVAHAVALAGLEVLQAVGRRAMHHARAGIQRDVVAEIHRRFALVEGMAELHQRQRRALAGAEHLALDAVAGQRLAAQFRRQHQQAARRLHQLVGELRVQVERLVAGNRPRRRRPDHRIAGAVGQRVEAEGMRHAPALGIGERKGDVDGRRLLVLVFDLGLGQRRAAIEAPVHRLQALEEEAALVDLAESADLVGLVAEGHRQVGVVPLAQHAEADEILLLALDLLGGKGAAQRARLVGRQVLAVQLLDLVLDRQAVAVPARHIGRVEAGQRLRAHDDVLEDLVDGMADVDVAVGVRRAVVEYKPRPPGRGLADLLVELAALPVGDPLRLAPGEIALHREGRVGKVQGFSVVGHVKRTYKRCAA